MSKELDALEDLYHNIGNSTENYLIVETALKNYEHLYQLWNCKDSDTMIIQTTKTIHDENNKKLKAFEIIKEKLQIDVSLSPFGAEILYYLIFKNTKPVNLLTQEEYNLLKEILL